MMQLHGILDVLIITCMLREAFTSYFRDHVSLNINQAQTYGGRADVATTQYCHGCLQQDLHALSKLLLLGQEKTFCPIHPSNSVGSRFDCLLMCINLAILVPMAISSAHLLLTFPQRLGSLQGYCSTTYLCAVKTARQLGFQLSATVLL